MIDALEGLYLAFDYLFLDIERDCKQCEYDDCRGYVWLLRQEAERLIEEGVEVLEVNKHLFFINCFSVQKGKICVEEFKPVCPLLKAGRCTIHSQRPLVCRMYPLSFSISDGTLQIVLSLDCLYSRHKMENPVFKDRSLAILRQISHRLLGEIIGTYEMVLAISKFPRGQNNCIFMGTLPPFKERR